MYRHPGLLAKIVATLDVLSGGRAQFGIGSGWYEREQLGLGVPVVPVSEWPATATPATRHPVEFTERLVSHVAPRVALLG